MEEPKVTGEAKVMRLKPPESCQMFVGAQDFQVVVVVVTLEAPEALEPLEALEALEALEGTSRTGRRF